MASYPPLEDRPLKNTICLFDVDDTLSVPRQVRLFPLHSPILAPLPSPVGRSG